MYRRPRNHRKRHARKRRQTLDRKRDHLYSIQTLEENIYPRVLHALDRMDDLSAIVWSYVRPAIVSDDHLAVLRHVLHQPWIVRVLSDEVDVPLPCSFTHVGCELFFQTRPLRRSHWLRVSLVSIPNIRDFVRYVLWAWCHHVGWDPCDIDRATVEFVGYTTAQTPVLRFTLPHERHSSFNVAPGSTA